MMDKERIKGAAKDVKGSIKTAIGKLFGNKKLETEGRIDRATGAAHTAVGEGKDKVREILKDRKS